MIIIEASKNNVNPRLITFALQKHMPRSIEIIEKASRGRIELHGDSLVWASNWLERNHINHTVV